MTVVPRSQKRCALDKQGIEETIAIHLRKTKTVEDHKTAISSGAVTLATLPRSVIPSAAKRTRDLLFFIGKERRNYTTCSEEQQLFRQGKAAQTNGNAENALGRGRSGNHQPRTTVLFARRALCIFQICILKSCVLKICI